MSREPDYRMYVDETGTHGGKPVGGNQYLCLMGCIINRRSYGSSFVPQLQQIKRDIFGTDSIVLHRYEVEQRTAHFSPLNDRSARDRFNTLMAEFYRDQDYTLIAIGIDKAAHIAKHGPNAWHPYHYCVRLLFERYCHFLNGIGATGDAAAESRNDSDNELLKAEWKSCCDGESSIRKSVCDRVITNDDLHIRTKRDNIAGLQLADMLLAPAFDEMLVEKGRKSRIKKNAYQHICRAIFPKWRRNVSKIWGAGKVFLE